MGESQALTVCSLSRKARLGAFYDARLDKFVEGNLFRSGTPPSDAIKAENVAKTAQLSFNFDNSWSKKCQQFGLGDSMKMSVLSGMVELSGSAGYLRQRHNDSIVKGTLTYSLVTTEETINPFGANLKDAINQTALVDNTGTHVVVGITWGAKTFATFEIVDKGEESKSQQEKLQAKSNLMMKVIQEVDERTEIELDKTDRLNIEMFSDFKDQNKQSVVTTDSAVVLMKLTPTLVSESKGGKGKALWYKMCPLSEVINHLGLQKTIEWCVKVLDSETVMRTQILFKDMIKEQANLEELVRQVQSPVGDILAANEKEDITSLFDQLIKAQSNLGCSLREALVAFRSGGESSLVEDVIVEFSYGSYSPRKIRDFLEGKNLIEEKISWYGPLMAKGVRCLSKEKVSLEGFDFGKEMVYVLAFTDYGRDKDKEEWKINCDVFETLLNEDEKQTTGFYVWENHSLVTIYQFLDGRMKNGNVAGLKKENSVNVVRFIGARYEAKSKPDKRAFLNISCPVCQSSVDRWYCSDCQLNIEYGFDSYYYCGCGTRTHYQNSEYKCSKNKHEFREVNVLKELLETLEPIPVVNYLILGETGNGKSTFINAFANYVTYQTLFEAEHCDSIKLIPSSFSITNDDYQALEIKVGFPDDNEKSRKGSSSTQKCRSYCFPLGEEIVRLIDTPGIGDTRGVDVDSDNFENILKYIGQFSHLNGILILMKPNVSRINVTFRFCLQQLLTHLDREATENIVFLFAHTMSTGYLPGETLPLLKAMLGDIREQNGLEIKATKETMYCLDSESFRYLTCAKQGIRYGQISRESVETAWRKSVEECRRMMRHVKGLKSHSTTNILKLNETRKLIDALSRPIGDINKLIQETLEGIKNKKNEIEKNKDNIEELKKHLVIHKLDFETIPLNNPRTVCKHDDCREHNDLAEGVGQVNYKQICHDPCWWKVGSFIYFCTAFHWNGTCKHCGHSARDHMQIYYELKQTRTQETNQSKIDELKTQTDYDKCCKETLTKLEQDQCEYQHEQRFITMASAQFTCFLKSHSILPYNDSLQDYMDHLIKVEESSPSPGRNERIQRLKESRDKYLEEIVYLKETIQKGNSSTTVEDIDTWIEELCSLKHNGPKLKKIIGDFRFKKYEQEFKIEEATHDPSIFRKIMNMTKRSVLNFIDFKLPALTQDIF